jgi:hypothetical protein
MAKKQTRRSTKRPARAKVAPRAKLKLAARAKFKKRASRSSTGRLIDIRPHEGLLTPRSSDRSHRVMRDFAGKFSDALHRLSKQ